MYEKRFAAVLPQMFSADGGIDGSVSVVNTRLFKVKQQVVVTASGQLNLELEVKKILSLTSMIIGPITGPITAFTNLSAYTVITGAGVFANEQRRPIIDADSWNRATYEEEPIVAKRVVLIDELGNKYGAQNPLPTTATLAGTVTVGEIAQGLPNTLVNAWPVKITDGVAVIAINPTGSINVADGGGSITVDGTVGVTGSVSVSNFPVTQPISAGSLPLPTGAATSTIQTDGTQKTQVTVFPALPTGSNTIGKVDQGAGGISAWKVDGSAVTQPISGTVTATGPLTDTQLRATAVPVSGSVSIAGTPAVTISSGTTTVTQATGTNLHVVVDSAPITAVTGPLTDTQLRTSPVPVSLTSTTITGSVAVTGPLTDTQLRATAVPVSLASTTVTGSVAVTGPLTDTQLRATAVPISGTVTANAGTGTMAVSVATLPLPSGAATETTLAKLPVAQATALGTNSGPMVQGSVTAAAPTYTTGNINPLSLTTAGALRTDSSGTTQPVSLASTTITGSVAVTGPLTDIQLRATAVPVSNASLPLPLGASTSANQATQITSLSSLDAKMKPITLAAFGELLVAELVPITAWRFDYGINPLFVTTTSVNGGTATVDQSRAVLSTSTAVAGSVKIETRNQLRYLPGIGGLTRFTTSFGPGTANNQQIVGLGTNQDGLFFGYLGTSFGIMRRRASVDTWVSQASWNGEALGETLVPQLGNVYQIRFQWLGYGVVKFYIFDKTIGRFALVHTIQYPNTSNLTHTLNPTFPLMAENKNTGNNTNIVMYTPSAMGALEGAPNRPSNPDPLAVSRSFDSTVTIAATTVQHLVTLQNKATAYTGSLANRAPIKITSIDLSRTGTPSSVIKLWRNATTVPTQVYVDVNAAYSPAATSITATTVTSTDSERSYSMDSNVISRTIDLITEDFIIYPGETFSISTTNSGTGAVVFVFTVNWLELF